MVANETGLSNLTLETIWNVYDTLFCEVSQPGCLLGLLFCLQQVQVSRAIEHIALILLSPLGRPSKPMLM